MSDDILPITMPKWGLSMTEGMVSAWHVKQGDELEKGRETLDIETEKITNAFEAPVSGTLRRVTAEVGEVVPVGGLLGVVAEAAVSEAEIDAFIGAFQASFQAAAAESADAAEVTPEFIDLDGMRIRYLTLGPADGPPLVLVHGFGGDLNNWLFNQPLLAETFAATALDLPGHGASSKWLASGRVEDLADAVLAFLDALDVPAAHLVGHSLGGAVAGQLAVAHPRRCTSLTMICPLGLGPEINMGYIEGFIGAKRRKDLKPVVEKLFADPALVRRELLEDLLKFKRLDGVEAALMQVAEDVFPGGRQALDLRSGLEALELPAQVVWGAQDQIVPATHGEGLADRIAVHVHDDAGHMVHMEKAAEVTRQISDFAGAAR